MRYSTAIATGVVSLLVAACGSGGAEPTPVPVALTAEMCTEGEARDTKLYIKNLDDLEWRDITISLSKAGNTYTREWASLAPESQQAATPFTDSVEFYYTGKIPGLGLRAFNPAQWRLHNFSSLEGATIEISSPQPGKWAGEVHPCQ